MAVTAGYRPRPINRKSVVAYDPVSQTLDSWTILIKLVVQNRTRGHSERSISHRRLAKPPGECR